MVETPMLDALLAEVQDLRDAVEQESARAETYRIYCDSVRPVWQNFDNASAVSGALAQLWEMLGAKHQTEACAKIRKLLDLEPAIDGRRAQTLELYQALGATDHASAMEAARTWVPPKDV